MEYKALIEDAAKAHALPPGLVEAVVGVESGGNPWAFRYEPQYYERHVAPDASTRAVAPCSRDSERQALATSWGLMQVMGATARSLGFQGAFLNALCDPAMGLEYGCRLLARLRDRYKAQGGWPGVVAAYNAGSPRKAADGRFVNQSYVDNVARMLGGVWPQ